MIDIKTGKEMTRRDFIGGGIAAASMVGLAGSANATVRHGLGARLAANFGGGGGGWVNPYVTDGLVAMWDGEFKGGAGIVDPSPNGWIDCQNGVPMPLNGNSFVGNRVYVSKHSMSASIDDLIGLNDDVTIEMTFLPLSGSVMYSCFLNADVDGSFSYSKSAIYANYRDQNNHIQSCYVYGIDNSISAGSGTNLDYLSIVFPRNGNPSLYHNGSFVKSLNKGSSSSKIKNIGICIGLNTNWVGNVYNLRVYNTSLNQHQIDIGYATSLSRFSEA